MVSEKVQQDEQGITPRGIAVKDVFFLGHEMGRKVVKTPLGERL